MWPFPRIPSGHNPPQVSENQLRISRGGHWPPAFLYIQFSGECGRPMGAPTRSIDRFTIFFAFCPHPSRLRRATFPQGKAFRMRIVTGGNPWKGPHQSADWLAMTYVILFRSKNRTIPSGTQRYHDDRPAMDALAARAPGRLYGIVTKPFNIV